MAKFLKSIFHGPEKRRSRYEEGDDDRTDATPTVSDRRKLSISRSGRLRQANKKRHSLTLDLYGENIQPEKPKSIEYHVHNPSPSEKTPDKRQRRRSADNSSQDLKGSNDLELSKPNAPKRPSVGSKSPEEEIDSAFEIIDRS